MPKRSKKSKGIKKDKKSTDGSSTRREEGGGNNATGYSNYPMLEMMNSMLSDALQTVQSGGNVGEGEQQQSRVPSRNNNDNVGSGGDALIDMLQGMMSENMKHYVSFEPGTNCRHGHQIPTIDCQVGMECISGYEDALNMSADARFKICTNNDEPKFTSPDEAAVTSPSPLWHKKVLHLMRVCYMQCCSTYDVFLRCILTNDYLLNLSYSWIFYNLLYSYFKDNVAM